MKILAHRGLSNPDQKILENRIQILINMINSGFDLEFDVNLNRTLNNNQLVLAHDPISYNRNYDFVKFLGVFPQRGFHALNIKNLSTVKRICNKLSRANLQKYFFLFDFELLHKNINECRNEMFELSSKGFNVAFRLSEKEKYFDKYLSDEKIKILWLDEFSEYWLTEKHIRLLSEKGKKTFYVSPDLHGNHNLNFLKRKWEYFYNSGVTGICTDYASELKKLIGEDND